MENFTKKEWRRIEVSLFLSIGLIEKERQDVIKTKAGEAALNDWKLTLEKVQKQLNK